MKYNGFILLPKRNTISKHRKYIVPLVFFDTITPKNKSLSLNDDLRLKIVICYKKNEGNTFFNTDVI